MRVIIGMVLAVCGLCYLLWATAPRLVSDALHAKQFVPAYSLKLTGYQCTNVNGFMWNHCTTTYVSVPGNVKGTFEDWRFGRAPNQMASLMQRRGDASAVTTDVSLDTLWSRGAMVVSLVLFAVLLAFALLKIAVSGDEDDVRAPRPGEAGARQI